MDEILTKHHTVTGFRNPSTNIIHGLGALMKWQFSRKEKSPEIVTEHANGSLPESVEPDLERINNPPGDAIQLTWIGHSTFLIQVAGVNILTDPILSQRCSPVPFAGDSGYCPYFKEIGSRFGQMSVSMIPIGAYRPRWFMSPVHVDPAEAVQIHKDVRSKISVAMHWGTFRLTDEPMGEPPVYLRQAMRAGNLADETFIVPKLGDALLV